MQNGQQRPRQSFSEQCIKKQCVQKVLTMTVRVSHLKTCVESVPCAALMNTSSARKALNQYLVQTEEKEHFKSMLLTLLVHGKKSGKCSEGGQDTETRCRDQEGEGKGIPV